MFYISKYFSFNAKPRNFAYSLYVDLLRNSFSLKNKTFKKLRNKIIMNLKKNKFVKDLFLNFSNKGFKF